jgi:hypothetical protein
MKNGKGIVELDFSNYSLGLNTKESQFGIKNGQAYNGSINARFKSVGFDRAPGFFGLGETPPFTTYCKGLEIYSRSDGTQKLMGVSNGRLYEINTTTNAATERYNITGTGEAFGCSAYDKFFIANGAGSCMVENETGYQIGITPPAACTVAAAAGGTLPDGVYTIYVGYALKVDGVNVLYSQGLLTASVTLGSGNNTIAFSSFANSSNTRVNNKVVWMSAGPSSIDAGTVFFYHETGNNTSTSFNITNSALRDNSKEYRILANPSQVPPVMTGLIFHDDRLFGWKNNVLYASMKAASVYDLERWPNITYSFPFHILSLFTIGTDLYLNTNNGIIKLPDADMQAKYDHVTKRLFYKYVRTVSKLDDTSGNTQDSPVIGWTNDGVRIFNGDGFTIDLSKDVKPNIQMGMNNANSTFQPDGFVCRSNARSEYRISYRDTNVNAVTNNRQLILNLDTLTIQSNNDFIASWELWEIGFTHACIDANNVVYMAQSLNGNSQVFTETWGSVANKWVYGDSGALITVLTPKEIVVVSKIDIVDIIGRIRCEQIRVLSQLNADSKITVQMGDEFEIKETKTITNGGGAISLFDDVALFDEAIFTSEQPIISVGKLKGNLKGSSAYIIYRQTADDVNMNVITIKLYVEFEQGHQT